MKDLHYRPNAENKLPATIISLACALALSFLALASSGIGYSSVFHALVLLFGALAIFYAYRYYLSFRTYHLKGMDGRTVLTVTDTQGRRISTAFYLYLDEVTKAQFLSRAESKKLPRQEKTFIFSNTLRAQKLLCIDADTELGCIRLILGADETFAAAFAEALALTRAQKGQKDAETDE